MVSEKRILIVEGNTREENNEFTEVGIKTHTESLIDSIDFYKKKLILILQTLRLIKT